MTGRGNADWRIVGCAALLGASIAFPVGLFVGGGEAPREDARMSIRPGPSGSEARTSRNVYSPQIASDPYVVEQQRRVLRALEASCSEAKRYCAEAQKARLRIEEAEAAR